MWGHKKSSLWNNEIGWDILKQGDETCPLAKLACYWKLMGRYALMTPYKFFLNWLGSIVTFTIQVKLRRICTETSKHKVAYAPPPLHPYQFALTRCLNFRLSQLTPHFHKFSFLWRHDFFTLFALIWWGLFPPANVCCRFHSCLWRLIPIAKQNQLAWEKCWHFN